MLSYSKEFGKQFVKGNKNDSRTTFLKAFFLQACIHRCQHISASVVFRLCVQLSVMYSSVTLFLNEMPV